MIEERNRLAREIHDTLAQGLTGIALKLESVDAMLETDVEPDKIRQTVAQLLNLTRSNLEEARRSVLDLRAAPLEGRNLIEALAVLVQEFTTKKNLQVNFNLTGGSRPLPVRIEVGLYRIAQEGLNNIVQHAGAQQVDLELVITAEQMQLVLEDDGDGFDPSQVLPVRFGLIGINERVKLLGGSLRIESSLGEGTRIEVTIPLE
jgi:two-component system NarL family sensor kinase